MVAHPLPRRPHPENISVAWGQMRLAGALILDGLIGRMGDVIAVGLHASWGVNAGYANAHTKFEKSRAVLKAATTIIGGAEEEQELSEQESEDVTKVNQNADDAFGGRGETAKSATDIRASLFGELADCHRRSEDRNVLCLRLSCFAILTDFEADLVALMERAAALERRNVDEYVLSAIVRGDEAEALVYVEKLYGTCHHLAVSSRGLFGSRRKRIAIERAVNMQTSLHVFRVLDSAVRDLL